MPDDTPTILIADTDRDTREDLARELDADGYRVVQANTPVNAAQLLGHEQPAILILGTLGGPGAAPELLRELRAGALDCPAALAVLTLGPADTVAQLRAYEAGSDHHVPADVSYVLLRSVVVAVIRRCTMRQHRAQVIEAGGVRIDIARRQVRVDDEPVELSKREFELLCTLASDPTRVFDKQQLLADVWGHPADARTRTLDSHACRLRRRLGGPGRGLIVSAHGVGYSLLDPRG